MMQIFDNGLGGPQLINLAGMEHLRPPPTPGRLRTDRQDRNSRSAVGVGFAVAVLHIALCSVLLGQESQSFKIEFTAALPPEVASKTAKRLSSDGLRLVRDINGVNVTLGELWPVKAFTFPPNENHDGNDYRQLPTGHLIGILHLPQGILDFRLQRILPGTYAMKYRPGYVEDSQSEQEEDLRPQHSAVEVQDVVTLTPVASDRTEFATRSARKSTVSGLGTKPKETPPILALLPLNRTYKDFPSAISDDTGRCALQFKIPVSSGSRRVAALPIVILLVNPPDLSKDD